MGDGAFVFVRMFLVILRFDGVAQVCRDGPDLLEPLGLVVAVVVGFKVTLQDLLGVFIADLFRDALFDHEVLVIEVADEVEDLLRVDQVFSWFCIVSADVEDLCQVFLVAHGFGGLWFEFLCPVHHEVCQLFSRDLQEDIL